MDSLEHPRSRRHVAPSRVILCLTLRLYPARDASLALSDLVEIREQQLRWCANAVQSGQGLGAGTLGDCMLFHFEQGPSSAQNLQQAATLAQDLCIRVQRRSRMLEVQHGVRLEISGSMHTATMRSQGGSSDSHHAANVTLHLNSLAGPGTVLLSHRAHHELAGRVKMEAYASASKAHPPEPEPVYRLAPATHQ
jgi:class 3 adenylate cyclase